MAIHRTRDTMQERHGLGANSAPHVTRTRRTSRHMRRASSLALALSICALTAPVVATAATTTPSPFKADRASSVPSGLTPNSVAAPLTFPEKPVILTWGEVPGAVGYTVEVSDTPGFAAIVWKADTVQPIAVPETLLPDGQYWWRVKAVDAAGTVGAYSSVARFAKTWPSAVTGTSLSDTPGGAAVTHLLLQPYMTWKPVTGAANYDIEVAAGDQFATPSFFGKNFPEPFATPAILGALDDDSYGWRVRARDANDNPGPWTTGVPFTRAWIAPTVLSPADGAAGHDMSFSWAPVDGAESYDIQITEQQFNWSGTPLKITGTTAGTSFTPTFAETRARSLGYGNVWWRVRPRIDGIPGTWSSGRKFTWQAPAGGGSVATLDPAADSDTGLMPRLSWAPVAGATMYRVDIAADPQFNTIVESQLTESTSWTSRAPLRDNQVGTGYWWRVVWGNGFTVDSPGWMVDEDLVAKDQFRKQTRVTLGQPANGGVVTAAPLLTWSPVQGVARFEVEMSQDGQFGSNKRSAIVWGTGVVPGNTRDSDSRLPDGTWNWRVRAVDGAGSGQTWSPVGQFTLNSPRPVQKEPNDGEVVVFSPLVQWGSVPGACKYDVQVARDPSFPEEASDQKGMSTMQTALVPPKDLITTPGVHYWRVRADYCDNVKGQWSPTRSFRSVFPPDFNLNAIPKRVDYRANVVVSGQLKHNGAGVGKARIYLERRTYPSAAFRAAGMIRTNPQGRFAFSLKMARSADYRLVWREEATHPEGIASWGIDVQPRVTFRLATSRVVRKKGLLVKGSIYPKRPAAIQIRTADGWKTLRKVKPTRQRFAVTVSTGRIDPGTHRLRLWVPRDSQRKFTNAASRQRGVLVYDRFVVR